MSAGWYAVIVLYLSDCTVTVCGIDSNMHGGRCRKSSIVGWCGNADAGWEVGSRDGEVNCRTQARACAMRAVVGEMVRVVVFQSIVRN